MEEILGVHNDDRDFANFLGDWRDILAVRVEQASAALWSIPGICGLILAGSMGRGEPWPLSDIDFIPVYEDEQMESAIEQVEQARISLMKEWSHQGWRTGVDVGRLRFSVRELESAFATDNPDPVPLLRDDRWYHAIDKAFEGEAIRDRTGRSTQLVSWFTANRFAVEVARVRLERAAEEARRSRERALACLAHDDRIGAFSALLKCIQWRQIYHMERWGARDNSLGRFGTRFERAAALHDMHDACRLFNELSSMSELATKVRLNQAPRWVQERLDRSWQARHSINEPVSQLQNDRDVLRVCTIYELRVTSGPPYPAWLGIPSKNVLCDRLATLSRFV